MSINRIGDLWLEVTRRCNMSCSHCCRGEAQNVDMDCAFLNKLLKQIGSVGMLGFTGGEPTLVPDKLLEIFQTFKNTSTTVNIIQLITNGKELTDEFIYAWSAWLDYCDFPDNAQVFISGDEFHEKVDITYYEDILNCKVTLRGLDQVFAEGRKANDNSLPRIEVQQIRVEDDCIVDPIYLNYNGDLLPGVDWSYVSQEHRKICNVSDGGILTAIKGWNK